VAGFYKNYLAGVEKKAKEKFRNCFVKEQKARLRNCKR